MSFPESLEMTDISGLEPVAFPDESYAQFIDCMNRLLPNVRFIFMLRDPVATIWSMRSRLPLVPWNASPR